MCARTCGVWRVYRLVAGEVAVFAGEEDFVHGVEEGGVGLLRGGPLPEHRLAGAALDPGGAVAVVLKQVHRHVAGQRVLLDGLVVVVKDVLELWLR